MDKRIALNQRSDFGWTDVEFAKGDKPGISDVKSDSAISEWLVTASLSCRVLEFANQGILIRFKKLSQILLDDDLQSHFCSGGGGEVVRRESERSSRGWEDKAFVL